MANFDNFHWERFEPDIGDNHKMAPSQRLYLEIACGLTKLHLHRFRQGALVDPPAIDVEAAKLESEQTKEALEQVMERLARQAGAEKIAAAWAPFVRLGAGSHSIGGLPLTSLKDYLFAALEQKGSFTLVELVRAVQEINSVGGTRALFSERLFGGSSFTAVENTDAGEKPPESH